MTTIDIIALVFIFLALVKITVVLVNRKSWLNVSKLFYDYSRESSFLLIILGVIVFFFLLDEMSIVHIIAVIAFSIILLGLAVLQYPREFLHIAKKSSNRKISIFELLYIVFWIILLIWAFVEIIS